MQADEAIGAVRAELFAVATEAFFLVVVRPDCTVGLRNNSARVTTMIDDATLMITTRRICCAHRDVAFALQK